MYRDLLSDQTSRVAAAVEPLVVMPDRGHDVDGRAQRADDVDADLRMLPDLDELLRVERSGLGEDRVQDPDLADVVQQRAAVKLIELFLFHPEPRADVPRRVGDPVHVTARVRFFRLDRRGQRKDDLLGVVELVVDRLEPQRRLDASHQLDALDRLGHEVIGSRLERRDAVGDAVQRRDHHDRDEAAIGIGLDAPAHLVAVHAGHLHVEQHEVGLAAVHRRQCGRPVRCESNLALHTGQAGLDELAVGDAVVHHQH